ncbi:HAMP domain-containing protein [Acidovorax sp. DW039]|uniref:ATP-binding protein n=1 Tax=Acidovorax sp. DW039 TaxID=3095606 RepID=UPI00308B95C7|nr:HAMP domain-containing protein [Acidovorax sp. DW039]
MAALSLQPLRSAFRALARWLVPSTLFGRLALLLLVAVFASHVLALSLMWELRPPPPPGAPGAGAWQGPAPPSSAPSDVIDVKAPPPSPAEAAGVGHPAPAARLQPPRPPGPPSIAQVMDAPPRLKLGLLLDIGVRLAVLLAVAWWAARWLAQPMHRLASAAQELGRNLDRPTLPEDGPAECRDASRVFNQMQARLRQQLADRDGFVAAVSHDLRTPLTRLRLRAEALPHPQDQERFGRDIAEMDAMITATLDYLRGVAQAEPWVRLDVAALAHSLADDQMDMGHAVTVQGQAQPLAVQAGALRRCLDNLVGNAVRYGGSAEVTLQDEPAGLVIAVRDHGPGLPEAELARVMAPFYRVEASRNRGSGGVGLGLTIAQDIVRRHGGELRLSNAPGGGLLARVWLPRAGLPPEMSEQAL